MRSFNILFFTLILIFSTTTLAADNTAASEAVKPTAAPMPATSAVNIKEPNEFQKVVQEYKDYISKISPKIRDEIIAYRKEIARINKEKRSLYKNLTQESQDYLKKEQEFKKRLPLNKKSLINVETPGQKPAENTNKN